MKLNENKNKMHRQQHEPFLEVVTDFTSHAVAVVPLARTCLRKTAHMQLHAPSSVTKCT